MGKLGFAGDSDVMVLLRLSMSELVTSFGSWTLGWMLVINPISRI